MPTHEQIIALMAAIILANRAGTNAAQAVTLAVQITSEIGNLPAELRQRFRRTGNGGQPE